MEEQNKYYTPDISELHVGYECELSLQSSTGWYIFDFSGETPTEFIPFPDGPFRYWSKVPIIEKEDLFNPGREIQVFIDALKDNRVRTKYLDKEDIESCGWEENNILKNNERNGYRKMFSNGAYFLAHYPEKNIVWIQEMKTNFGVTVFKGECKSINELRKIMQRLKIK